ncbi:GlcG/HbpS family heme-binding protein [Mycobacterium sp. NPDC003449]
MTTNRVYQQHATITDAFADELLEAAVAKAGSIQQRSAIAIVDAAGELKAFRRMDGAATLAVRICQDKAYTAVAFGMATHVWHDFIKDDPPLRDGIVHTPRLIVFGGGYPITVDGHLIGGIGVSGGHYSEDMEVAEAALDLVEAATRSEQQRAQQ